MDSVRYMWKYRRYNHKPRSMSHLQIKNMWESSTFCWTTWCDPVRQMAFLAPTCEPPILAPGKTCILQEPNIRLNVPHCLPLLITSCSVHVFFFSGVHQMLRFQGVLGFAVLNAPWPWFEPCFHCCPKKCGPLCFYMFLVPHHEDGV